MSSARRRIFHWQYSGPVIAFAGTGAMTAALSAKFAWAYFGLAVALVFSIGLWLTSDLLTKRTVPPKRRILMADGTPFAVSSRERLRVWLWRLIPSLVCIVIFALAAFLVRGLQIDKELEALSGWLYPSDEDVPSCPRQRADDIAVMAGGSGYVDNVFPATLIGIQCDDLVKLERDAEGRVGITLTVYDKDGRVIVDLKHGHFDVNQNNYFRIDRQGSRSTLSVVDQNNREVLYLHYANKNVLQFRASLFHRGIPVIIDDAHPFSSMTGARFSHSCFGHSGGAVVQIGDCLVR